MSQLRERAGIATIVKAEDNERRSLGKANIGTQRIDIELVEQLRFRASFGRFSFTIDEPAERGGTDQGLPPLAYFIAGAASCLMTQYAKLAIVRDIPIKSMKAVARGHFDRRIGGAFRDMIYEISIESPADEDMIKRMAREAESMCFAHNTLRNTIRMKTSLRLNGRPLQF